MKPAYKKMLQRMQQKEKAARSRTGEPWFLYILECSDGSFYTGITNNIERRLKMHNDGKASRYTRRHLPVALRYQEECRGRTEALVRECAVKALPRKKKDQLIATFQKPCLNGEGSVKALPRKRKNDLIRKFQIVEGVSGMDQFMREAIKEAKAGLAEGGIPIGAVLVHKGKIIGRGHNQRVQKQSAILHGETAALENAGRQKAAVYRESVMYTTLSPCSMCTGAILLYGIPRVVIGENKTFMGEEELLRGRGVKVEVLQDAECIAMMKKFIKEKPGLWNEDIGK